MIQIKSSYGSWKTVDRKQAEQFIRHMLDGGCVRRQIDGNHLRGISIDGLLQHEVKPQVTISRMENCKPIPTQSLKIDDVNKVEMKDCVVEFEMLARKEAFYRFEQNILFSLVVWQNDKKIREQLPPVTEWLSECIKKLNSIVQK